MIFLVDLPEPTHGLSNVNRYMLKEAKEKKCNLKVINTCPSFLAVFFPGKLWSIFKLLFNIFCSVRLFFVLVFCSDKRVYRSINGGLGQIYDVFYIIICRVFGSTIYIHHHSFAYLNKKSRLFSVLSSVAGSNVQHIVLGERMGQLLSEKYDIAGSKIKVLSNLSFFESHQSTNQFNASEYITIGHLSNLCVDKGIQIFADLCKSLSFKGIKYKAIIAGPFSDPESKDIVNGLVQGYEGIEYLGPLYGEDKDLYFNSLDLFVFPSMYINEAEPLVIYEAAEYGAFILGTQQGCMDEVILSLGGNTFPVSEDLPQQLLNQVLYLNSNSEFSCLARKERQLNFQKKLKTCKANLQDIMAGW